VPNGKLIVVSVRPPVSVHRDGDGRWEAKPSPGGLATALRGVSERRSFTWLGWPGVYVAEGNDGLADRDEIRERLADAGGVVPVFIDQSDFEGFYEGFSNGLLWPLFHSLPERAVYDREQWKAYQRVNRLFADAVAEVAEPGDVVWVHDYQLALVPLLLRRRGLQCAIGFFLHIPFPSSDAYRTLPVREALLEGMLGADLLGFHSYEYVSHFRSSCLRVLGLESEPETIYMPMHAARLNVLPIGIEPGELEALAESEAAALEFDRLRERFEGRKVIAGVDRLDYTKGIPQKLLAFEELLATHPELREQVVMVQVASPSRTGVAEYQDLKREVDELVGRINGKYATTSHVPLVYINQHVERDRLTALYRVADVALVTPVRDGMNLVSLEYIAARTEPGTLILSEFAGAASCLAGARLVNPHNPHRVAEILADALANPPSKIAFEQMVDFVYSNTSGVWAQRFLARLENTYEELELGVRHFDIDNPQIRDAIEGAQKPLLLLDYDGTITPHAQVPEEAVPSEHARDLLRKVAELGVAYVVSGRPAVVLDEWLGDLGLGFVCEHGLNIKDPGGEWPEREPIDRTVLDEVVRPLLHDFVERTPGSKLERKAASLAWHYRAADPKFGAWRAKELHALLDERLTGQPFSVLVGSKVIEVRHNDMTKGRAASELLERHGGTCDLVIAAGNDHTDEEMFDALARSGHHSVMTCRVGSRNTRGQFHVESSAEFMSCLRRIVEIWSARGA